MALVNRDIRQYPMPRKRFSESKQWKENQNGISQSRKRSDSETETETRTRTKNERST